jgi:hypothetical protein
MLDLRNLRDRVGVVPTTSLMPLALLGTLVVLVARIFLGIGQTPLLSVVIWGCVAIVVAHWALLIAQIFGWTVWDLVDRAPTPTTTTGDAPSAHDDEDRVL